MTLSDYIQTIGGAASQIVAATNGAAPVSTAPAAAVAPAAKPGLPKWAIYTAIGLAVALGGFLLLRRRR